MCLQIFVIDPYKKQFKFTGNVVPPEMSAVFDIRLANDVDFDVFERMVTINQNLINHTVLFELFSIEHFYAK